MSTVEATTIDPEDVARFSAIADEWIGIKPGTDGAFVMALIHELLHADKIDLDYLVRYTNAPWLVIRDPGAADDGLFARGPDGEPLCWDSNTNQMVFKTAELVEWISKFMTINPGDVICWVPISEGNCDKASSYLQQSPTASGAIWGGTLDGNSELRVSLEGCSLRPGGGECPDATGYTRHQRGELNDAEDPDEGDPCEVVVIGQEHVEDGGCDCEVRDGCEDLEDADDRAWHPELMLADDDRLASH